MLSLCCPLRIMSTCAISIPHYLCTMQRLTFQNQTYSSFDISVVLATRLCRSTLPDGDDLIFWFVGVPTLICVTVPINLFGISDWYTLFASIQAGDRLMSQMLQIHDPLRKSIPLLDVGSGSRWRWSLTDDRRGLRVRGLTLIGML